MTEAEAKVFCVTKWEHIVANEGNPGDLYVDNPELSEFVNGCAYCTLYIKTQGGGFESCRNCPIRVNSNTYKKSRVGCEQDTHPYRVWDKSKTTANAQAVLDLINTSPTRLTS